MIWQRVCTALLAGAIVAVTSLAARAADDDKAPAAPAPAPAVAPAPAPAAAPALVASPCGSCGTPCTKTVTCVTMVPEYYQCKRTVMKTECKQECYTAYKTVCEPVCTTRMVTCYQQVPECRIETRIKCVCVPCVEERTVMQKCTECRQVVKTVKKCVDKGHYECRCEECKPSCLDKLSECFKKKDCCSCCEVKCPKYKTVKVWVPCPTWEEKQVCCTEKVTVCKPMTCKVTVNKIERHEEKVQVKCMKCVAVQKEEKCTVMKTKCVPYQCTRTVKVCVPCEETYTACRMVKKCVEKQVPVVECCSPCCEPKCAEHKWGGLFKKSCGCGCN